MKIKTDFVSNSSSTSFIYISKEELTIDSFFSMVGVEFDSPLNNMFTSLFYALKESIDRGDEIKDIKDIEDGNYSIDLSVETLNKVQASLDEGYSVILADLSSDGELHESFLCVESFEIESSDFIISAYNNYW
jgi:hypothetical protein